MNRLEFVKMHGQGNDFVIIDSLIDDLNLPKDDISGMCDRHFGIGADGLIFIRKSQSADFFMDYYNQDGTTAEMCGNGIRCMAGYVITRGLISKDSFTIDTRAGIKNIKVIKKAKTLKDGVIENFNDLSILENSSIRVDMGGPIFDPVKIPVDISKVQPLHDNEGAKSFKREILLQVHDFPLEVCGKVFNINCVSMGNPHCVIFLEEGEKLSAIPINEWGSTIENHPIFPAKTNVEFIEIENGQVFMRVWERGVGETLACGTGACASAVCSMSLGKIKNNEVKINLPGGSLDITWQGGSSTVFLEGKVKIVFEGIYYIN